MTQTSATQQAGDDKTAIRPFRASIPEEDLADLRRRIAATRWPEKETVNDSSQGVQLATTQKLAQYWATEYDWRRCEAQLNSFPQFITEIDGLDIHFIHAIDARHNQPRIGRVVMARGRDAVDVALTTSFGATPLTQFTVWTDEVPAAAA